MSNRDRLLTLIRTHYVDSVGHYDRLEALYRRIQAHEARNEMRECVPLWDQADRELDVCEREDDQFAQELAVLYQVTSPDEFSKDEHEEMAVLMDSSAVLAHRLVGEP
jgi:hypothetical protein